MLKIQRPSHTTQHDENAATEQSKQKRPQYENGVLKAYGIVPVRGYSSNSQGKSVDLKLSQTRWKRNDPSFTLKSELANHKSRKNDSMSKLARQPWSSDRRATEVRTTKYEKDVLKAYGFFQWRDIFQVTKGNLLMFQRKFKDLHNYYS